MPATVAVASPNLVPLFTTVGTVLLQGIKGVRSMSPSLNRVGTADETRVRTERSLLTGEKEAWSQLDIE